MVFDSTVPAAGSNSRLNTWFSLLVAGLSARLLSGYRRSGTVVVWFLVLSSTVLAEVRIHIGIRLVRFIGQYSAGIGSIL